jgi:hypothetical protein
MPNGDSGGGFFDFSGLFGGLVGFIVDIINAIIQFLVDLVAAIVNALNFLFAGEQSIFGFSFASLSEVWNGLKKLTDAIFKNIVLASLTKLFDLYKKLKAWATKLKAWLDKLHAIMQRYQQMYLRQILQIIQRARKILVIFRFFHLKFAQKLDNWLATIEGKIAHYLILVAQKTNEIISWVNLIVDPRGALKAFPFLAGLIAALDVTWSGIFGTPFTWWLGLGPGNQPTGKIRTTLGQTGQDVKTGAGDAGAIKGTWPTMQAQVASEMGGT